MEQLTDLKAILHSKRANVYYLEKYQVIQKDDHVLYLTEVKDEQFYWNIPIVNATVILLGTGISVTQAAVRILASAGILIVFSDDGGTSLNLAYGLAASTLWVLGIPHGFAVMHGQNPP